MPQGLRARSRRGARQPAGRRDRDGRPAAARAPSPSRCHSRRTGRSTSADAARQRRRRSTARSPSSRPAPASTASPIASSSAGQQRGVQRQRRRAGAAQQARPAACGGAAVHDGVLGDRRARSRSARAASAGWGARSVRASRCWSARGPASTAGSDGSSSCSSRSCARARAGAASAGAARSPSARLRGRGRARRPGRPAPVRRGAARASAASVHGPAACTLSSAGGCRLGGLLQRVEVTRQQVAGAPPVAARPRSTSRQPLGLQVDVQPGQQRRGAAGRGRRPTPRPGSSGRNGRSGSSPSTSAHRLVAGRCRAAADPGGGAGRQSRSPGRRAARSLSGERRSHGVRRAAARRPSRGTRRRTVPRPGRSARAPRRAADPRPAGPQAAPARRRDVRRSVERAGCASASRCARRTSRAQRGRGRSIRARHPAGCRRDRQVGGQGPARARRGPARWPRRAVGRRRSASPGTGSPRTRVTRSPAGRCRAVLPRPVAAAGRDGGERRRGGGSAGAAGAAASASARSPRRAATTCSRGAVAARHGQAVARWMTSRSDRSTSSEGHRPSPRRGQRGAPSTAACRGRVAVVEHRRLPGRDAAGRRREREPPAVAVGVHGRR